MTEPTYGGRTLAQLRALHEAEARPDNIGYSDHLKWVAAIRKAQPDLLAEIQRLRKDAARLDWLEHAVITPKQAEEIVNGGRWNGKYCGSLREAIDAAMEAK